MSLYDQMQETVAFIKERTDFKPRTALILGTGLGHLTDEIAVDTIIPYAVLPHFASSTVVSHKGQLILGRLANHPVVAMAGRFHYYEGWTMQQVTFPVRVMAALGVERFIITNASGGVNPHLQAGDLVVVKDHINLLPEHPLRGTNDERLGPRFPDMSQPYDRELRDKALSIARKLGVRAVEGVYSALQGPNLETPAEYGMLRRLGSDCTGMSSVPEVLVARHMGLPVLMISLVANVAWPPSVIQETTVDDVVKAAESAEPGLRKIIMTLLSTL